ncbi:MAG TPA: hypothetical protein VE401_10305 [Solirubrobacterales bacterium]|jgi:hypothetical protein|nr:hypothetical protein [Solirubrobacterales bacterium]
METKEHPLDLPETKEHPLDLPPESNYTPPPERLAPPPPPYTEVSEPLVRQAADGRRLHELAAAVRDHEAAIRSQIGGPRPHDLALYRLLRRTGGPAVSRANGNGAHRQTNRRATNGRATNGGTRDTGRGDPIRSSGHSAPGEAVMTLVEAIRAHELLTRNRAVPTRPADHALYRGLDQR